MIKCLVCNATLIRTDGLCPGCGTGVAFVPKRYVPLPLEEWELNYWDHGDTERLLKTNGEFHRSLGQAAKIEE